MVAGRIELETSRHRLVDDPALQRRYLGVDTDAADHPSPRPSPSRRTPHDASIHVALIGSKFMGRAHSNAWSAVGHFFDVDPLPTTNLVLRPQRRRPRSPSPPGGAGAARRPTGGSAVTDAAIDLVDVATPNDVHADQAIAALEAGKHVACEKPLAGTLADAEVMAAPPPPRPAGPSCGSTADAYRPSRWPTNSSPAAPSAPSATSAPRYLQSWGGPDTPAALAVPGRRRRLGRPR